MKICYSDIGILVIDGSDKNIKSMELLSDRLMLLGYQVMRHTGDMKKATYKDWVEDVEKTYLSLKERCRDIVLIGYSMGGLLSLQLAKKFHVKGIITLESPIFKSFFKKIILKPFNIFPIKEKRNINQLVKDTKKSLSHIKCDRLINDLYCHKYRNEMAQEMILDMVKSIENG